MSPWVVIVIVVVVVASRIQWIRQILGKGR